MNRYLYRSHYLAQEHDQSSQGTVLNSSFFSLRQLLAGISEIEESVTPATTEAEDDAKEEEGEEDRADKPSDVSVPQLDCRPPRCRQRRRSSQTNLSQDERDASPESGDGKLTRTDNNNLCDHTDDFKGQGQTTPVLGSSHRIRSTSDTRSPARSRASTGSTSTPPLAPSSGPSSTCSSPRHPASHRIRKPGYPRRSLSLPNGGLSYGSDVKILYRDGHFVAVVDPQAAGAPSTTAASSSSR